MSFYTDKRGNTIELSDEQLKELIALKLELQKASPSQRASWSKIAKSAKRFNDNIRADEEFRQFVKNQQKRLALLPTAKQYTQEHDESLLDSIKEELGNVYVAKQDAQMSFRQLNRFKQDLLKSTILYDTMKEAYEDEEKIEFTQPDKEKVKDDSFNQAIVLLSDIHFGKEVIGNYRGAMSYNPDIASKRLYEYASKVIDYINDNDIDFVRVINLGDVVEGELMRATQPFEVNLSIGQQVAKVSRLITSFLARIAKETNINVITYSGIRGNHDRLIGDKNLILPFSDATYLVNENVHAYADTTGNVEYQPVLDEDFIEIDINDKVFYFVHGDKYQVQKNATINALDVQTGKHANALIGGHYHSYKVNEVGLDRYLISVGSLVGADDYAVGLLKGSKPSQLIIGIVNGEIDYKKVDF